jgi:alcohol dehydrogenase (cytochrome c)
MNRRPDLIAPVLVMALALIVMGGIATGLSETGDPGATVSLPTVLPGGVPPKATGTGAVDEPGTVPGETDNATLAVTAEPVVPTDVGTPTSSPGPLAGADWPLPNGDSANTRAVAPAGGANLPVSALGLAWSADVETGSRANPVIVGGRVFVQDERGTTYAVDLATGEELWRRSDYVAGNATGEPTAAPTGMPTEPPAEYVTVEPTGPAANVTTNATENGTADLLLARELPVLAQAPNETPGPTTIATLDSDANVTATVTATANATPTATATDGPTAPPSASARFRGQHGPVAGNGRLYVTVHPASIAALDQATGEVLWTTGLASSATMVIAMQPSFANGMVYASTSPGPDPDRPDGGGVGTFYAIDAASGAVRWEFATVDSADIWGNPGVNAGGGARYGPATDGATLFWSTAGPNPAPGTSEYPNAASRPGPNLWTNGVGAIDAATGTPAWFTQAIPADIFDHDFMAPPVLASAVVQGQDRDLVVGAGEDGHVTAYDRVSGAILWESTVGRNENSTLERIPDAGITAWPGALGGVQAPMAVADGHLFVASNELPTSYMPWGITSSLDLAGARGRLTAINLSTGRTTWQLSLDSAPSGGVTVVGDAVVTATFNGIVHIRDRATGRAIDQRFLAGPITSPPAVGGETMVWHAGTGENARVFAVALERAGGPGETTTTPTPGETSPVPSLTPEATTSPQPTVTGGPTTPGNGGDGNTTGIAILSPASNETGHGPDVPVTVEVTNFTLVDPLAVNETSVEGRGHIRYFLDAVPPGEPAVTGPGTSHESANTTHVWTNVTPGVHTLSVMLMKGDHTPVVPLVQASATVLVGGDGQGPAPVVTVNDTGADDTMPEPPSLPTGAATTLPTEAPTTDPLPPGTFAPAVPGAEKQPPAPPS